MREYTAEGWEKGAPLEFRAEPEKGLLSGYASKFWVVDAYGECTAPGCFAQTIAERGPQGADRILLRYEHYITIGKHTVMREDEKGLYIEARISDDGADGTRVRRHLADGVPYGLSIGFRRVSDRSATEDDPLDLSQAPNWIRARVEGEGPSAVRVLTGVKLFETSVVSFPAVDNALVEGYRSSPRCRLLSDLVRDLRAGQLSEDELAAVRELVAAWPADGRSAEGESSSASPVAQTARRNYRAEFALLAAELRGLGIDLPEESLAL